MSESKFNTRQYQNVIGGGTETWMEMSPEKRQELRDGISTNLNVGLTLSPFGGGGAGAYNLIKVIGSSIRNPKNALSLAKGLLNAGRNYFTNPVNIGKKVVQKSVFTGIDNIEQIEETSKSGKGTNRNPLMTPNNAP